MNLSEAQPEATDSSVLFGAEAIREQAWSLQNLALSLDDSFDHAVQTILAYSGHLVISGMGKSGLVGRKMAATFASTGTPSFFVHPAEAVHGDLGMIRPQSLVVLISNSGETQEVLNLLPSLKHIDDRIIAMVGRKDSTLGREADIVLTLPVERERKSTRTSSSRSSGVEPIVLPLGRRLLCRVQDVMHKRTERDFPIVAPSVSVQETIWVMTRGRMGLTLVMKGERLLGIITDCDLRRAMMNASFSIVNDTAKDIMHRDPVAIDEKALWSKAEQLMSRRKIKALVALNREARVTGVVEIF